MGVLDKFASGKSLTLVILIYLVGVILIFIVSPKRPWNTFKINGQCLIMCDKEVWAHIRPLRGKSQLMVAGHKRCLMSGWQLAHFVYNLLLGFVAPKLFWYLAAIGVGWEVLEMMFFDCHDWLDVPFNIAGLILGVALRECICPP
jgi:hypothetical protein